MDNHPPKPTLDYWHVWIDADGISHQSRCQIQAFALQGIAADTAPQWMANLKQSGATITFMVLPVGWIGQWHENPKPQWIVPLSGRWFVETMDGYRVEMGPGEISFGEDQGTKLDSQGRQGHLSGTVGSEPAVLVTIQLDAAPTVDRACHLH